MVIPQKLAGGELMPSSTKNALEPPGQQGKEREQCGSPYLIEVNKIFLRA